MLINILLLFFLCIVAIQFFMLYSNVVYVILLITEIIIIIFLWLIINKNRNYKAYNNLYCNQIIIEILRKYRHDMSNNIQIISCYATLKRNEDIIKHISLINYYEVQQNLIATFSNIQLTAYLYKIHALFPELTINLKIEEDIKIVEGKFNEKLIYQILDKIINVIYLEVNNTIEQHLSLSIGSNDKDLIIILKFEGSLDKIYNKISKIKRRMIRNSGNLVIGLNTDQESIINMYFPLKKV